MQNSIRFPRCATILSLIAYISLNPLAARFGLAFNECDRDLLCAGEATRSGSDETRPKALGLPAKSKKDYALSTKREAACGANRRDSRYPYFAVRDADSHFISMPTAQRRWNPFQ